MHGPGKRLETPVDVQVGVFVGHSTGPDGNDEVGVDTGSRGARSERLCWDVVLRGRKRGRKVL